MDKIINSEILRGIFFDRLGLNRGRRGLLRNLALDLLVANTGLFIGYMSTAIFYLTTNEDLGRQWLTDILLTHWLYTVPLFTLVCCFGFFISGLYANGFGFSLVQSLVAVFRAVALVFLLYIFLAYLLQQLGDVKFFMLPRSAIIVGWGTVLVLLVLIRIGKFYFKLNYIFLPRPLAEEDVSIDSYGGAVAEEFSWVPIEKARFVKGGPIPVSAYFTLWPYFSEDTVHAAASVLRSGKVNRWTGEQGLFFERDFSEYCHCEHAISVANGTVALELALRSIGVGPDDEVIVPCRTFIASASCVVMCGAKPVLVDVDHDSQNLTSLTIQAAISAKTKVIIAVHLAGWPCDMDAIMSLAKKHDIKVVEDCAQAHGATYKGRPVGSLGDVAAFSFCQDKIMTTGGEGGMLTTNNLEIWKKAWGIKDHGKNYDAVFNKKSVSGYQWIHDDFGTNWRLTELQSAVGRNQLGKLPGWVEKRRRYAAMLSKAFSNTPGLRVTLPPEYIGHSYYKYYVFIRPDLLKEDWDRDRIMAAVNERGIPCFSGICGQIYKEKAFIKNKLSPDHELLVSDELMRTSLMFLVHPTLINRNILDTIRVVQEVMGEATKRN